MSDEVRLALARALTRSGVVWQDCEGASKRLLDEIQEQRIDNGNESYATPLFGLLGSQGEIELLPLGAVPYLPPLAYCEDGGPDHERCGKCRPLTPAESAAHEAAWRAAPAAGGDR